MGTYKLEAQLLMRNAKMAHLAAPPATAPLLVVQHAARSLRVGNIVRLEDGEHRHRSDSGRNDDV